MDKIKYYVLLVETGKEILIKKELDEILINETVLLPQRELFIKKFGKVKLKTVPLFSGYIFLKVKEITPELLDIVRNIKGIYRILNSNSDMVSLSDKDIKQLGSFLKKGYNATVSTVMFNQDDKIIVTEGPLKEFEGRIVKVDKRKKRAKVQLTLYNNKHLIDFSFLDLESKI